MLVLVVREPVAPSTPAPESTPITALGSMGRMMGSISQMQGVTYQMGEAGQYLMATQMEQLRRMVEAVLAQWGLAAPVASAPPPAAGGEAPVDEGPTGEVESGPVAGIPEAVPDQELQEELEGYLQSRPGSYGAALRDLDTGQIVLINANSEFPAASTYKLLVMYRVYQYIETGLLDPNQSLTITQGDAVEGEPGGGFYPGETVSVVDALEAMITVSSNTSAYALTRLVGGWDPVSIAADELGMSHTSLRGDGFWTTPADMLKFLEELAQGRLVSPEASRQMIELLELQTLNAGIPSLLPAGAVAAHKTGELDWVTNDVGIVYGPGGRFIICVLSQGTLKDAANEVVGHVALRAYQRYAQ